MIKSFKRIHSGISQRYFWFQQKFIHNFSFIHIKKCGGTSIEHFLGIPKTHDTAAQRIQRIGLKKWEENFTFSIVRNPYSRVVSYYKWFIKKYQLESHDQMVTLNEWVASAYKERNMDLLNNPFNQASCYDSVALDNQIIVKNIIKLETLDDEWEKLCHDLRIKYKPLNVKNQTSMHTTKNALDLLNDSNKAIIRDHFKNDFEAFGYEQ